jgi:hypothetical protein
MFSNRVPMGSDTPSPEPLVYFSFIHVYLPEASKRSPSTYMRKNIRSPSTEPHADGRPTYNGVCPGSPRGLLQHCYHYPSAMQPSAQYLPSWLGETRAPLASMSHGNPHQGIPSTTVTASHVTQGRAE